MVVTLWVETLPPWRNERAHGLRPVGGDNVDRGSGSASDGGTNSVGGCETPAPVLKMRGGSKAFGAVAALTRPQLQFSLARPTLWSGRPVPATMRRLRAPRRSHYLCGAAFAAVGRRTPITHSRKLPRTTGASIPPEKGSTR